MNAIILAAGRGARMDALTRDTHKCLLSFRGKTLLQHQIHSLSEAGCKSLAIVTGYKRKLLLQHAAGFTEFHNPRWAETNMVSSLLRAEEWLADQPCLVSYSDIVYSPTPPAALARSDAALSLTYDPNWLQLWSKRFEDPLSDAETFRQKDGRLLEIGAKPRNLQEVQGQYMGLLKFTPRSWQRVKSFTDSQGASSDKLDMTTLLQALLRQGLEIEAIPINDVWYEFDSGSDLEATL